MDMLDALFLAAETIQSRGQSTGSGGLRTTGKLSDVRRPSTTSSSLQSKRGDSSDHKNHPGDSLAAVRLAVAMRVSREKLAQARARARAQGKRKRTISAPATVTSRSASRVEKNLDEPSRLSSRRSGTRDPELHNFIEKKRRAELADCYSRLRDVIPENFLPAGKVSNVVVLQSAVIYINDIKARDEKNVLKLEHIRNKRQQLIDAKKVSSIWAQTFVPINIVYLFDL